jgi:hypothetical protein|tara:strand:+ start:16124 stop:16810 length:687 start_codon:yes stop_codon:yes gene_type:complete
MTHFKLCQRRISSFFILMGLFLVMIMPVWAHFEEDSPEAIEAEEAAARLPEISILPDSFFYFLKTFKEAVQGLFIITPEDKLNFLINKANTRLAEYVDLVHLNRDSHIKETLDREEVILREITGVMVKAQEEKSIDAQALEDLEKTHLNLLDDHQKILLNMEDDVPENSRDIHSRIIEELGRHRLYMEDGGTVELDLEHSEEDVSGQPLEEDGEEHDDEHEEEEHTRE